MPVLVDAKIKKTNNRTAKAVNSKNTVTKLRLILQKDVNEVKIKITDKTKIENESLSQKIVERPRLEPMVQSPLRFPALSSSRMLSITRVVAIVFILFGSFSSLFHFATVLDVHDSFGSEKFATVITSTGTDPHTGTTGSISSTTSNTIQGTVSKPSPTLFVENFESISGTAPITITVPFATEVKVLLYDIQEGRLISLGVASNIDSTTWQYLWNTKDFHDGSYRIKLILKNQFNTYEHTNASTYTLKNNTAIETSNSSQNDNTSEDRHSATTSTSTPPVINEHSDIELSILEDSPVSGSVALKIKAMEGADIKIYAKNTKALSLYYIGKASHFEDLEWKAIWDSTKVPNGQYEVQAKATIGNQFYESKKRTVTVANRIDESKLQSTSSSSVNASSTVTKQEPQATIRLSAESPLSGTAYVYVDTPESDYIELYTLQKNATTPFFVGSFQKMNDQTWKFAWQTRQTPNGEYDIFARVKNSIGSIETNRLKIKVLNETLQNFSVSQEEKIESLTKASDALSKETDGTTDTVETATSTSFPAPKTVFIQPVETFIKTIESDENSDALESLLKNFRVTLSEKVEQYAKFIRNDDTEAALKIKGEIENLKDEIIEQLPESAEKEEIVGAVNTYLSQTITGTMELAKNNEIILKERIGDVIHTDSDKDGISDYDELNLYKTNAFSADTDGDGFIDGAEITRGFDPHNIESESKVAYESPKESGMTRDDLLIIDSVRTLTLADVSESDGKPRQALISGKGLPNSFVTIFIFSTPVIVTVKTDDQGNWSYIFDKDLENGDHEVIIGITDNTGKIIAKSSPLPFVKTAEAFTSNNEIGITQNNIAPSFFERNATLTMTSLLIIILGFVLIFLGMHIRNAPPEQQKIPV